MFQSFNEARTEFWDQVSEEVFIKKNMFGSVTSMWNAISLLLDRAWELENRIESLEGELRGY